MQCTIKAACCRRHALIGDYCAWRCSRIGWISQQNPQNPAQACITGIKNTLSLKSRRGYSLLNSKCIALLSTFTKQLPQFFLHVFVGYHQLFIVSTDLYCSAHARSKWKLLRISLFTYLTKLQKSIFSACHLENTGNHYRSPAHHLQSAPVSPYSATGSYCTYFEPASKNAKQGSSWHRHR